MTTISADIYLEFIENHLPALKAGQYRFSATQSLKGAGIGDDGSFELGLPAFQVRVAGERLAINPAEIVSVFPPNNSLGHYANVLPHIAFKRDTLPWERMIATSADADTEKQLEAAPWLALLVLNEDELLTDAGTAPDSVKTSQEAEGGYVKTKNILDLGTAKGAYWPPELYKDEDPSERFKVIYVRKETLQELLPSAAALTWLAHARRSRIGLQGVAQGQRIEVRNEQGVLIHQEVAPADDCSIDCGPLAAGSYTISVEGAAIASQPLQIKPGDQVGGETAIVVANRLPKEGVKSIIHLVSLEGRYKQEGNDFVFDFDNDAGAVALVTLYNWSFTALTEKETFRHILLHLNHQFLFGIDADSLAGELTLDSLRSGFLAGRNPLSDQAQIVDVAKKELRDKDHCYYVGEQGAVYNAAGRKVADGTGAIPVDKDAASAQIPDHRLHQSTAEYLDATTRQLWVADGSKQYFVSEDPLSKRLLVYLLPGDDTPSLRLPSREGQDANTAKANHFLQQGYVPLPHHFRRGGKSVSWYRSPLLAGRPGKQIPDDQFPVHTADELLRYDATYGMFDASYAAAWELGRLLCLQNKRVSLTLYRWKRTHVRLLKAMEQQHLHPHLPFQANAPGKIVLPDNVEKWLSEISLLKGLPFSYLAPDERMLPMESLRFFYLDPSWIASLVDGALSIGRVNKGHDAAVHRQALTDTDVVGSSDVISGFLLRSSVVKGWPNLQVNAYNYQFQAGSESVEDDKNGNISADSNSELPCLRMARLADNVLLGLFRGEMKVLDFHENPETIHFGFDIEEDGDGSALSISKHPVKANGLESDEEIKPEGEDDYLDESRRVIRPAVLASAMQKKQLGYTSFTSAQFALSLTEGVSRVRFILADAESWQ